MSERMQNISMVLVCVLLVTAESITEFIVYAVTTLLEML